MESDQYTTILGIPFGEDFDEQEFLEQKYMKMKALISAWKDHARLTAFGKSMLANSMIFSRFRYYAQCLHLSGALHDAIESDAQALVWSREADFDAAEQGTAANFKRWMKKNSQFGNRKQDLGIGLLPWKLHVDSLQVVT